MNHLELYADRLPKHRRTWTFFTIILILVFVVLGQLVTILGLEKPLGFHSRDMDTNWMAMAIKLFGFAFGSVLVLIWVRLFERRPLKAMGFNAKALPRFIRGYALGLGFVSVAVGFIFLLNGYMIERQGLAFHPDVTLIMPIVILMAGFIVQGSSEEIFFRGWLLQNIISRHGIFWGLIISSLVFTLLHAGNIKPSPELMSGLGNIVLFAIFIGLYAIKEGSIWGVCGWHAAWNWLLGVGFGLEVSGQKLNVTPLVIDLAARKDAPWWLTGGAFGPEGSVVTTGVLLVGIIWLLAYKAHKPAQLYGVLALAE